MLTKENVIKMIVKYYYILKYYLLMCLKSWIFSITTRLQSHDPSEIILICWLLKYIFLTYIFSGFLGKYKVQKDNMYLK